MVFFAHRGLALLILLLTLASLGGLATTVAALATEGRSDACCSQEAPVQDAETNPCAAECSCASCLTLVHPLLPSLGNPLAAASTFANAPIHLNLSTFVATIDYPPEAA